MGGVGAETPAGCVALASEVCDKTDKRIANGGVHPRSRANPSEYKSWSWSQTPSLPIPQRKMRVPRHLFLGVCRHPHVLCGECNLCVALFAWNKTPVLDDLRILVRMSSDPRPLTIDANGVAGTTTCLD